MCNYLNYTDTKVIKKLSIDNKNWPMKLVTCKAQKSA